MTNYKNFGYRCGIINLALSIITGIAFIIVMIYMSTINNGDGTYDLFYIISLVEFTIVLTIGILAWVLIANAKLDFPEPKKGVSITLFIFDCIMAVLYIINIVNIMSVVFLALYIIGAVFAAINIYNSYNNIANLTLENWQNYISIKYSADTSSSISARIVQHDGNLKISAEAKIILEIVLETKNGYNTQPKQHKQQIAFTINNFTNTKQDLTQIITKCILDNHAKSCKIVDINFVDIQSIFGSVEKIKKTA